MKRFKSDNAIVEKLFLSFQRDKKFRHGNRKGMSNLNYKQFIINLNNYLYSAINSNTFKTNRLFMPKNI